MLNVAIIGRHEILYKTAILLHKKGYKIKFIITAKASPEYNKDVEDFRKLAKDLGAVFFNSYKFTDDLIEAIKGIQIDIGVSMNYPTVIPKEVIDLFPLGILNAHGGDLPRYRGNACQAWAILNGEDKIGLCIHKMEGGKLDSGDIIERKYYPIDINTKITQIYEWFEKDIPYMFLSALEKLQKDPNYFLERQDESKALRCYPLMPEDGRIDWKESNVNILRKINAFNKPYGGAFCFYRGKKMIIWDAELYDDKEKYCAMPGQVADICDDGSVIIIAGNGKLKVREVEYDGFVGAPKYVMRSIRNRLE